MKKNIFKIGLVMLTIGFFSCSNDDNDGGSTAQEELSLTVDGTQISADEFEAVLYTNAVAGGRYIDVYGSKNGNEFAEFHFPAKTGSFPAQQSFNMASCWLTYENGVNYPDNYFHSTSGTLTVTVCDTVANKIEATFNFTGNNLSVDKVITDGKLKINSITRQ
ncbi:hypothetical protein [Flavobacterium sp.]|uniref:hypothetical protein n=1 Tax=Flavobacterium sp. TaxID=239 RepID=UPI0025BD4628|nr:hypothetical protein [Flavobacterium sp.]MBA4153825.1 hypothetical protein [Flavobacterium sp.]